MLLGFFAQSVLGLSLVTFLGFQECLVFCSVKSFPICFVAIGAGDPMPDVGLPLESVTHLIDKFPSLVRNMNSGSSKTTYKLIHNWTMA